MCSLHWQLGVFFGSAEQSLPAEPAGRGWAGAGAGPRSPSVLGTAGSLERIPGAGTAPSRGSRVEEAAEGRMCPKGPDCTLMLL